MATRSLDFLRSIEMTSHEEQKKRLQLHSLFYILCVMTLGFLCQVLFRIQQYHWYTLA